MRSSRHRPGILAAAAIGLFVSSCLYLVWCHQKTVRLGYRLEQARKVRADLLDSRRQLEAEIATLRTPERLEKIGKDDLGMRFPAPNEILSLDAAPPASRPAGTPGAAP